MSDAYVIAINGIGALDAMDELPREVEVAALRAVNRTLERARATAGREIRQQVALPARYLSANNSASRLQITRRARPGELEGVITGRGRPTSLARFSRTKPRHDGSRLTTPNGVTVEVQPGRAQRLDKAFFVRLRSGSDGSLGNLGLAIRLPAGQVPSRAYQPKHMGKGLWLLYGPSVNQVFDDVGENIVPDMLDHLEREFTRQMGLKHGR